MQGLMVIFLTGKRKIKENLPLTPAKMRAVKENTHPAVAWPLYSEKELTFKAYCASMFQNYLTIAIRSVRKNRIFSLINVFGLAIGLACCILISLYVWDELHYDTYAANAGQVYRVEIHYAVNNGMETYPNVDIAVGEGIAGAFPQVRGYTRLLPDPPDYWGYGERRYKEEKMGYADANFLSFFSLPLAEGDAATALTEPNSIVIDRTLAKKYFGDEDALGKFLNPGTRPFKVTGVMEDMPDNSHFHFHGVISMSTLHQTANTWNNAIDYTYLLLNKGADAKKIEAGLTRMVAKYVVPETAHDLSISLADAQKTVNTFHFVLQPLRDIHFYGNSNSELEHNGNIEYVYIFSALAIFILVLACVNFTNLSTAIAARRGKEVGIRKVMGSLKRQLVSQFLAEAFLLTFLALLLAMGLVVVLLPYFNQLAGKHFSWRLLFDYQALAVLLFLWLITGVCAGGYPAFHLSSFNVIRVLKGVSLTSGSNGVSLRSGLVVFQFFVSMTLIIATLVIYRQLHFMQDRKLGYDKDQVVCVRDTYMLGDRDSRQAFRQQLMQDSRVVNASLGMDVPARDDRGSYLIYPKDQRTNGNEATITTGLFYIDDYYIPTLGMKIIRGRNFSPDFRSDSAGVIINEAAVRELGWSHIDPVGKMIVGGNNDEYKVVGVVADFNYVSLKQKIAPLMLLLGPGQGSGMIIKVNAHDMAAFLKDLEQRWKALNPGAPFSYYFLDERFATLYAGEQRTARLFSLFAILSILIACLGLFGLTAFTTEQRAKEIGIRKVLGASVQQVVLLVAGEFLALIGLAFLLAVPFAWWAMHAWLRDFAYREPIAAWVFVLAGFMITLIALVTVSSRAIGAALANPIKALRSE
jgi:putative ABC transport system permease protein